MLARSVSNRNFVGLSDVPTSYLGQAKKLIRVKATEDGLEYIATLQVPGNSYAFQAEADSDVGLYFNSTRISYDFRNTTAEALAWIEANTGAVIGLNLLYHAKAQVIAEVFNIVTNPANVRGLWFFDDTGDTTTIKDRSTKAHNVDLSANASLISPSVSGLCRHLTFSNVYAWDTVDHNDFSFGTGAADNAFSIVSVISLVDITTSNIVSKYDLTTGSTKKEYQLVGDGSDKINFSLYDESAGARIGRLYNTAITADQGAFHCYAGTYSGSGLSSGIKIYRDGVRVDDTDSNAGVYTAMENLGAKLGSYQTSAAGAKTAPGKYKGGVIAVIGEELTATQVARLDMVLRGYAGVNF